ncbi:hypothetical protein SDC9_206558 [bioreactor metagenome]|uniref:Uncharacterized protein n=1 Tax=bioreactor metagenome TaxID=1076179 RepID=A0A645J6U0_9ZZZZ
MERNDLRAGRRHLLHRLRPQRRAEQSAAAQARRAQGDRDADGRLGHRLGLADVRPDTGAVLHPALHHRGIRGRLLSGHRPLFHQLVPGFPARPHHGPVHVGHSDFRRAGQPAVGLDDAILRRPGRHGRLAVDVPAPGTADGGAWLPRLSPAQRRNRPGKMAERR